MKKGDILKLSSLAKYQGQGWDADTRALHLGTDQCYGEIKILVLDDFKVYYVYARNWGVDAFAN